MICPMCQGEKIVSGLVKFADGRPCAMQEFSCFRCGGAGEIPDEQAEWIRLGDRLRRTRIARGESLREAAKRLGVSAASLSDLEHGRVDPRLAPWTG